MTQPIGPANDAQSELDALLDKATAGDDKAISRLLRQHEAGARRIVRWLVGHPDDVNDVMQECLISVYTGLQDRPGDIPFAQWFNERALENAMNFLAHQRSWRPAAQLLLEDLVTSHSLASEIVDVMASDGFSYEADAHVAFCLQTVSRSLPVQQQVGVVLLDQLGWSKEQSARASRMREADVVRYRDDGAAALSATFDRLCGLVNEKAPCHHCTGLRAAVPEGRKGSDPNNLPLMGADTGARFRRRQFITRSIDLDRGPAAKLHDWMYRLLAQNEAVRNAPEEEDEKLPKGTHTFATLLEHNN